MAELGYRDSITPILGIIEVCCVGLCLRNRSLRRLVNDIVGRRTATADRTVPQVEEAA